MLREQKQKFLKLLSRQTQRLVKRVRKDYDKKEISNCDIELLGIHYCNISETRGREDEKQMETFHECLTKLDDPREVRILTLRFVEALTMEEIAQKEGISRKTVYDVYNASLKKIKDRLNASKTLNNSQPSQSQDSEPNP